MADPDEMWNKFLQQKQAIPGGAGAPSAAQADPKVYMGSESRFPNQGRRDWDVTPKGPVKKIDKAITLTAAVNRLYEDEKYLAKVRKRLVGAGLITPEQAAQVSNIEKVWVDTLETAAKFYSNGRRLTPWDVLDLQKKEYGKSQGGVPKGYSAVTGNMLPGWTTGADGNPVHAPYGLDPETGKPKGRYQTSSSQSASVNDLTDGDAWAIMQNAASQALGRDVSHEEIREFAYKANQIAAENPDEVRTTQTVDGRTGDSSSYTERSSGFNQNDAQKMAQEELEATPEAGAYQAATTYFNAMLGALDSPVDM